MKTVGIIFIIIGTIFGLFGVRSYLRDDAYAKASVVVKSSVKSVEVKPKSGKGMVGIEMVLTYMRDGATDSVDYHFSQAYSTKNPMPTEEELKASSPYVRYVPKEKRSEKIPNWVMINSNEEFDGAYGRSSFGQMFTFILLGVMIRIWGRKQ